MTKLLRSNGIWWFFAALVVFVYFYGLRMPLVGPDEPRYAQVAREMWQSGDWITPTLGGFEWFEKPALLYWLQIVSYHIFGVSELAARFGSALFGLGTVASLWILRRSFATENTEKTDTSTISVSSVAKDFPNWAALIAATTIGMLVFSRGASFDIIVTFPLTASLVGFFIFDQTSESNTRTRYTALSAFYFFAGVSVLAKGLIGVVFPFAIVGFYFLLSRRFPSKLFLFSLIWGFIVVVLVAAVWNLPMYLAHGWKFIDEFYVQHHFQRFTSNKYRHPGAIYYFLLALPLMTFPWLPFFLAAIWSSVRKIFHRRDAETRRKGKESENIAVEVSGTDMNPQSAVRNPQSLILFAISWILVPLVFFSFSGSKLPGYILPAIPPAAILTAMFVSQFVRKSDARRLLCFTIALAMLLAVVVSLTFVAPRYFDSDSVKPLIESADQMGYPDSKVAGFRTVSHNAEFYAPNRLVREADGEQKRFDDQKEFGAFVSANERPVLALVPVNHWTEFSSSRCYASDMIADNGELAIVAVAKVSVPCL